GSRNQLFANGTTTVDATNDAPGWCVAYPSQSTEQLKAYIDVKCQNTPEERELCLQMWIGGTCYEPDTAYNHASLLVNKLYSKKGKNLPCDNGILVRTDPSKLCFFRIS
ncbi:hypothetical protein A2U01_0040391, partial [Trifolium medium]|nr:hypothetical protein [Trifolium medium]